jgi:hypothetical protein
MHCIVLPTYLPTCLGLINVGHWSEESYYMYLYLIHTYLEIDTCVTENKKKEKKQNGT